MSAKHRRFLFSDNLVRPARTFGLGAGCTSGGGAAENVKVEVRVLPCNGSLTDTATRIAELKVEVVGVCWPESNKLDSLGLVAMPASGKL